MSHKIHTQIMLLLAHLNHWFHLYSHRENGIHYCPHHPPYSPHFLTFLKSLKLEISVTGQPGGMVDRAAGSHMACWVAWILNLAAWKTCRAWVCACLESQEENKGDRITKWSFPLGSEFSSFPPPSLSYKCTCHITNIKKFFTKI